VQTELGTSRHGRRSIRLSHFDYRRDGAYFVTICTYERATLFGSVAHGQMLLSNVGEIVRDCWFEIPPHFPNVVLDQFIVMPDHLHGIIVIRSDPSRTRPRLGDSMPRRFGGALPGSLATIVGVFKSYVTKRVLKAEGIRWVWQRNYYESVIRNNRHLNAIRKYIILNPQRWHADAHRNR